ncbi:MAG TPA: hypothetical protein DCS21_09975 [Gammaproteobacteria bacterium]|nr:hypothetical protein [Gammaproteobacteria bacterium]
MMSRKMKQLALAVGVALGGLGALPSAQAVSVSADNMGQALIFPYYTVRSGWNSLFGVTNTSDRVVAVKVRFREAENSRDVFDFTVILSPYDVWTGYLQDSATGPVLKTTDNSCTVGAIPAAGQPFTTTAYTGPGAPDGGKTTVDRLRDGYAEMIMMGAAPANPGSLAAGAIHNSNGVPVNCAALVTAFTTGTDAGLEAVRVAFPDYIASPLKGTFSLVNASPGKGFNAVGLPTALNNFRSVTTAIPPEDSIVTLQYPPIDPIGVGESGYDPTLAAANTVGVYYNPASDAPVFSTATGGAEAVTHALLQSTVLNEWSRRDDAGSAWSTLTDWVVTFPTKMFYTDTNTTQYGARTTGRDGLPSAQGIPSPFARIFNGTSCDDVIITVYDREEQTPEPGEVVFPPFSPWTPSPETPPAQLCYEANVLTFNKGALLGAERSMSIQNYPESFRFGWMRIDFENPLPAVGFAITSRNSSDQSLLREAALYDHSYIRD